MKKKRNYILSYSASTIWQLRSAQDASDNAKSPGWYVACRRRALFGIYIQQFRFDKTRADSAAELMEATVSILYFLFGGSGCFQGK